MFKLSCRLTLNHIGEQIGNIRCQRTMLSFMKITQWNGLRRNLVEVSENDNNIRHHTPEYFTWYRTLTKLRVGNLISPNDIVKDLELSLDSQNRRRGRTKKALLVNSSMILRKEAYNSVQVFGSRKVSFESCQSSHKVEETKRFIG